GNGTWTNQALSGSSASSPLTVGPYYLSAGFSFSTLVDAPNQDLYVFGGMCPSKNSASSSDNWTSAANYTSALLSLSPSGGQDSYALSPVISKSSPIPEAGHSVTALTPSITNATDADTQQQTFLLTGGHTATAF